jgi:pyruvate dehydrogenase E1 component alpha subunit
MTEKIHLDRAHLHGLYRQMLRIRRFEAKCVELYQAQKIRGFLHLYDGEEAIAVGVMAVLESRDAVVATYREHGQALARGVSMRSIMAEMLGKREGCCRGRGGSMHVFDAATRFLGGNAIVGGGLPLAAGVAMADQRLKRGAVTACFFGEGAVGEGVFHETMNLAELWKLPVLFVCENNLYAMGVPLADSEVETDIWRKARAYRMPAEQVDAMDPVQVEAAARRAVAHIRAGEGPYFLECRTYRFRAHSMFDTQAYRSRGEIDDWKHRDPIERLRRWMVDNHQFGDADAARIDAEIAAEIDDAVAFAEAGTLEPLDELERYVLMDHVPQDEPGHAPVPADRRVPGGSERPAGRDVEARA